MEHGTSCGVLVAGVLGCTCGVHLIEGLRQDVEECKRRITVMEQEVRKLNKQTKHVRGTRS